MQKSSADISVLYLKDTKQRLEFQSISKESVKWHLIPDFFK